MEKKLPFCFPPIETYQGLSFVLGCILGNENSRALYTNNYINIECARTTELHELQIYFTRAMWGDYWERTIAELDLYKVQHISRHKFFDFINERIEQNNYLLLYEVDEYYLSHSVYYHKRHVRHDLYIWGYDDGYYEAMAYKERKLTLFKINRSEIIKALYNAKIGKEVEFCTFRIQPHVHVSLSIKEVCNEMEKYLLGEGYNQEGDELMVFGINVYDMLLNCVERKINTEDRTIDIRPFRIIWEHKKIMVDRMTKLEFCFKNPEEMQAEYIRIERKTYKIFLDALKCSIRYNSKILSEIIVDIDNIRNEECNLWTKTLALLRTYTSE